VSRKRRSATRTGAQGAFKLFLVFLVLVGLNVYVFFFSPGNLTVVSPAAHTASLWAAPPPVVAPTLPALDLEKREGAVREREGLGSALRRDGVRAADVDGALRALRPLLDFKKQIVVGQRYTMRLGPEGQLHALELRAPSGVYGVARVPDGRLLGGKGTLASRRRPVHD
jgi:hypothetical protein